MQAGEDVLIERLHRRIASLAEWCHRENGLLDVEDLEQIGLIAVLAAARRNPGARYPYLIQRARWRMWNAIRDEVRSGERFVAMENLPENAEVLEVGPGYYEIVELFGGELTRQEKTALEWRYQRGLKVERIGANFGVTKGRVSQILSAGIAKLRTAMSVEPNRGTPPHRAGGARQSVPVLAV